MATPSLDDLFAKPAASTPPPAPTQAPAAVPSLDDLFGKSQPASLAAPAPAPTQAPAASATPSLDDLFAPKKSQQMPDLAKGLEIEEQRREHAQISPFFQGGEAWNQAKADWNRGGVMGTLEAAWDAANIPMFDVHAADRELLHGGDEARMNGLERGLTNFVTGFTTPFQAALTVGTWGAGNFIESGGAAALKAAGMDAAEIPEVVKGAEIIAKEASKGKVTDLVSAAPILRKAGLNPDVVSKGLELLKTTGLSEDALTDASVIRRGASWALRFANREPVMAEKIGKATQALVNMGFTWQMAHGAIAGSAQMFDAIRDGDWDKVQRLAVESAGSGLLAYAGARNFMHEAGSAMDGAAAAAGLKVKPTDENLKLIRESGVYERERLQSQREAELMKEELDKLKLSPESKARIMVIMESGLNPVRMAEWANHLLEAAGRTDRIQVPLPISTDKAAQEISALHQTEGGGTYSMHSGNMKGKEAFAVAAHPERSLTLDHAPSQQELQDYIEKNRDLLKRPDRAVGTWDAKDGRHILDVVATPPDEATALRIATVGREKPEEAYYDLTGKKGNNGVIDVPMTPEGLAAKYGTTKDVFTREASYVLPDGRIVGLPQGTTHDAAIGAKPTDNARVHFINNQHVLRARYRMSRAGEEVAFSIPDDGVTESQLRQMRYAADGKIGRMIIEVASLDRDNPRYEVIDNPTGAKVTEAVTRMGGVRPPSIEELVAAKDPTVLDEGLREQIKRAIPNLTNDPDEVADVAIQLMKMRSQALGIPFDQFMLENFKGFERGRIVAPEALEQANSRVNKVMERVTDLHDQMHELPIRNQVAEPGREAAAARARFLAQKPVVAQLRDAVSELRDVAFGKEREQAINRIERAANDSLNYARNGNYWSAMLSQESALTDAHRIVEDWQNRKNTLAQNAEPLPKGSTVSLLENPTAVKGDPTVENVGEALQNFTVGKSKLSPIALAGKMKKSEIEEMTPLAIERAKAIGRSEIARQLVEENVRPGGSGKSWYDEEIQKMFSALTEMHPELKNQADRDFFTAVLACSSIGNDSHQAVRLADEIYRLYQSTGKIHNVRPEPQIGHNVTVTAGSNEGVMGKIVDESPASFKVQVYEQKKNAKGKLVYTRNLTDKFITVMKDRTRSDWGAAHPNSTRSVLATIARIYDHVGNDPAKFGEWLRTKHTIQELRELHGSNDVEVPGSTEDLHYGAYAISPKVGAFFLNMSGIPTELTMDKWASRSWNRWMGTLIQYDKNGNAEVVEAPRGKNERMAASKAFQELADEFGLTLSQAQAVMWYYEQALWKSHGLDIEAGVSYGDAARKYVDEQRQGNLFSGVQSLGTGSNGEAAPGPGQNAVLNRLFEKGRPGAEQAPGQNPGGQGEGQGGEEDVSFNPETFAQHSEEVIPSKDVQPLTDKGNTRISNGAEAYLRDHKITPTVARRVIDVDDRARAIADAYEAMTHNPNDPRVKASYNALKDDVKEQWDYATKVMGIKFEPVTEDPYKGDKPSALMMRDVRENNRLQFWKTPEGTMPADHPMAEIDPTTGLSYNDMFRAVHDLFGHAAEGFEFGAKGEENAWNAHRRMFRQNAQPALASETKGQNSFVNFGKHLRNEEGVIPKKGEKGYVSPQDRPFAPQKAGLLPPEFWTRPDDVADTPGGQVKFNNGMVSYAGIEAKAPSASDVKWTHGAVGSTPYRAEIAALSNLLDAKFGEGAGEKFADYHIARTLGRHTPPADVAIAQRDAWDRQYIQQAKELLRSKNANIPEPPPITYYHGTHIDSLESILKKGLVPHAGEGYTNYGASDRGGEPANFLAEDREEAERYAPFLRPFSDNLPPREKALLIEMSLPHKITSKLEPDTVGDVLYRSTIPPEHIAAYHIPDGKGGWKRVPVNENAGLSPVGSGTSTLSNEELARNEVFYKITKNGSFTYQGKQPDAVSMKTGDTVIGYNPTTGTIRHADGDYDTAQKYGQALVKRIYAQKAARGEVKGTTEFQKDGRAIVRGFQSGDVSTLMHEIIHVFRRTLTPDERERAEKIYGVKDGKWTVAQEEKFARDGERYHYDGVVPDKPEIQDIFSKMKNWMRKIYRNVANGSLRDSLSDEKRKFWDLMYGTRSREHSVPGQEMEYSRIRELVNQGHVAKAYTPAEIDALKNAHDPNLITDQEREVAKRLSDFFAETLDRAKDSGALKEGVENYVSRYWAKPENNPAADRLLHDVRNSGNFSVNTPMARHRIFHSAFEGRLLGMKLAVEDPIQLAAHNRAEFGKIIAARKFLERLRASGLRASDGRPLVALAGNGRVVTDEHGENPAVMVNPNGSRSIRISDQVIEGLKQSGDLDKLIERGVINEAKDKKGKPFYSWDTSTYKSIDHPAFRDWNWVAEANGMPVLVDSDLRVHPAAVQYLQRFLGLEKGLKEIPAFKAAQKVGTGAKRVMLSLSPFHLIQEAARAIMTGVSPFGIEKWDLASNPKLARGVEHGLTLGRDYHGLNDWQEGLSAHGGLVEKIPYIGKVQQWLESFLFEKYIPSLKARAFEHLVDRYREVNPTWSENKVYDEAAADTNERFGGINYKRMGRSALTQDTARLLTLAPDWLESEVRSMGRVFGDNGKVLRQDMAKFALGMWAVARVLNYAFTGHGNYHVPFGVAMKDKEGKEKVYQLRTLPTDVLHAASDPGNFVKGRVSPLVRAGYELYSGRDDYGRKLPGHSAWVDIARNTLPIPVEAAIKQPGAVLSRGDQVVKSAIGVYPYRTEAMKTADELASNHSESGPVDPTRIAHHRAVIDFEDKLTAHRIQPNDVFTAVEQGQIMPQDAKQIMQNYKMIEQARTTIPNLDSDTARLITRTSRLPMPEFLQVWNQATPTEKAALSMMLRKKMRTYYKHMAQTIPPKERANDPTYVQLRRMFPNEAPF